MKVTIIGASGFIGRPLTLALRERGDSVTVASLRDPAAATVACAGADVVVNLAGEPVAQRWSPQVKAKIRSSRVDGPLALLAELEKAGTRFGAYVSASAIGYYGTSETETFVETSAPGSDFLGEVCVAWEAAADRFTSVADRVAKVRTGLVLGRDGGALAKLLPLFSIGAGGIVASGKQWYSWIAIEDQVGIYLHAIDGASGILNATAPNPVRNADFTKALAAAVHRPALFPTPSFAIGLVLGEGALVVTQGQRVIPEHTLASGYRFKYEALDVALANILK
jgi:uncharacterized protein (TIGR01777 family)